jgi:hypothetical protein
LNLGGNAITVVASGFLDPTVNSNGAGFGLWVALPAGGPLVQLPIASATTGIESLTNNLFNVNIFPNPASSMINVAWEQTLTENVNLQITNALGQTIKKIELGALQSGSQLIQISTEDINNGIYSVQLVSDKNVHSTMVKISK